MQLKEHQKNQNITSNECVFSVCLVFQFVSKRGTSKLAENLASWKYDTGLISAVSHWFREKFSNAVSLGHLHLEKRHLEPNINVRIRECGSISVIFSLAILTQMSHS